MSVTRLLVVADPKMLQALAAGLREGGRFEVATASLADPAGAQSAALNAEAIVVFYGGPPVVGALSAKVREKGGRVVSVLQKEQLPLRDDVFKAGASEVLFMPLPRDQFVARLEQAVAPSFAGGAGSSADVAVQGRSGSTKINARVTTSGLESEAELPAKAGETVKLAWGAQKAWGTVVRPSGPAQVRFAGLTADEEEQIRKSFDGVPPATAPAIAPVEAAPASSAPSEVSTTLTPVPPAPEAAPPEIAAEAAAPPETAPEIVPATTPPEGARAAPAAGPPPGFADRKPVRPQTRPAMPRAAPPVMTAAPLTTPPSTAATPPSAQPITTPPAIVPAAPAVEAPPAPAPETSEAPAAEAAPAVESVEDAAAGGLTGLFDEPILTPGGTNVLAQEAPGALGPPWPIAFSLQQCRAAALLMLQEKSTPADSPIPVASSARKVTGGLGSAEREAIQKAGSESHYAEALGARVALDAATSEGATLFTARPGPVIDAAAVAAINKLADEAASRLQKEANAAVTKGEVENLQLLTAASAALSRDALAFKETHDRLKGLGAAPRLGSGALDPDVVLPGQAPRASTGPKQTSGTQPVRAELRDFQGLDTAPGRKVQRVALWVAVAVFVVLVANAVWFAVPHASAVSTESLGRLVQSVDISGTSALVVVTQEWLNHASSEVPKLVELLREKGVKKALLVSSQGQPAGVVDVASGKAIGLAPPVKPKLP